nr:unnamed protein product [Digitaria exilis]
MQTTILSKRWLDLWHSVPAIDLDITDFLETGSRYDVNWGKMKDFTTNLLMEHSAQFLDAIHLRLGIFDSRDHLAPDVDGWALLDKELDFTTFDNLRTLSLAR